MSSRGSIGPRAALLIALLAVPNAYSQRADKIGLLNSKHDFRSESTSTGPKATHDPGLAGGDSLCLFCHTPHNSDPGPLLWNQKLTTTDFSTYTSSTMHSTVTPVTAQDSSKLCLSCHDGTIALGDTVSDGQLPFAGGAAYMLPSSSRANLARYSNGGYSDDHPFGFTPDYTTNTEVKQPDAGDPVRQILGKVQCDSCHDPHNELTDPTQQNFLVKNNQGSAICLSCHTVNGWANSSHKQPGNSQEDARYTAAFGAHTGYTGVANNGCESCHRPHAPGENQRLVKYIEEATCFQCHDGQVTNLNVKQDFDNKTYKHPVYTTPSVHDEGESPSSSLHPVPETAQSTPRHAECSDCHNPHASQDSAGPGTAPGVTPALVAVRGQTRANVFDPRSTNEYEICFKCHGSSANKPQMQDVGNNGIGYGRNPKRQSDQASPATAYNTLNEFETYVSFHPVTRTANLDPATQVPSLRSFMVTVSGSDISSRPLGGNTYIYCSDCHNSDSARNTGGGNSPNGPHASNYQHILERQYLTETPPAIPGGAAPGLPYSVTNYALCDKCHNITGSVMQDATFSHNEHVHDQQAACSTCHASHGAATQPMLVDFDLAIVGRNSLNVLQYTNTGNHTGTCSLSCHGKDHINESYAGAGFSVRKAARARRR